ncbi:MAG: hypothetical protein ABFE08_16175 [Armatimonadia bacterium]
MPDRLPRNFHKTFIPERHFLNALLRYAASGAAGTYQQIAAETGIPMGESSGKVPAIIDYARGMGLISLSGPASAVKRPELTPFGRTVLLEDPYLKEAVTQWLAHFHLCGPLRGADVWYQVFVAGGTALGMEFPRSALEERLALVYTGARGNLVGPLVRMYEDDAAFATAGVLRETAGLVLRKSAPVADEFAPGYGAWLLQVMVDHFPNRPEVTVTELDTVGGWCAVPGWESRDAQKVLLLTERKGLITVDRHMEPWIVRRAASCDEGWRHVFDDLI